MEETEGSCRKKRKKTVDETHDDTTPLSQENVTVQPSSGIKILSEAACALNASEHDTTEVQNQAASSRTVKDEEEDKEEDDEDEDEEEEDKKEDEEEDEEEDRKEDKEEDGEEDEEEESDKDSTLMDVEGYYVKPEVAPMLQRIFDKHKDIARECKIKNRTLIVPILEMICSFCHKLENTSMHTITMDTELEDMTLIIENFRLIGFNVEWLSGRLKDISKAQQCVKVHLALKEENTKIEIKEKEVGILKQKLSTEEAELAMMKMERDKVKCNYKQQRDALKVNGFVSWHKSMLNGLI